MLNVAALYVVICMRNESLSNNKLKKHLTYYIISDFIQTIILIIDAAISMDIADNLKRMT